MQKKIRDVIKPIAMNLSRDNLLKRCLPREKKSVKLVNQILMDLFGRTMRVTALIWKLDESLQWKVKIFLYSVAHKTNSSISNMESKWTPAV